MHEWQEHHDFSILHAITAIGSVYKWTAVILMVALACRYTVRKKTLETRLWVLLILVAVPNMLCSVFKVLVGRARPEVLFETQSFGCYGWAFHNTHWSFPSGHTTNMTALILSVMILFSWHGFWFVPLALMVIATRVLLTFHYLSDVLATMYLTTLEVGMLYYLLKKYGVKTLA